MLKVYEVRFSVHHRDWDNRSGGKKTSRFRKNKEVTGKKKKALIVARQGQSPDEVFWKHRRQVDWRRHTTIESIKLVEADIPKTDFESIEGEDNDI